MTPFSQKVITIIRAIPPGRVATYGDIAAAAENPRAARQVVRLLHSSSQKYNLPWQRVINKTGCIALTDPELFERQKSLLLKEGIEVSQAGKINLLAYHWRP